MHRAAVAFVLLAIVDLGAQPSPVLRGQVVDAGTGAPLARAAVQTYLAFAADRPSQRILTDDRGQFELPARPSFLHVSKAGFATTVVPAPAAGAPLRVALTRGAAVVGRVVTDAGQPATAVIVRAVLSGAPGATLSNPSFFTARSDDRGQYWIGALPPGRYTVTAVTAARVAGDAAAAIQAARFAQGAPLEFNRTSEPVAVELSPAGEVAAPDARPGGRRAHASVRFRLGGSGVS